MTAHIHPRWSRVLPLIVLLVIFSLTIFFPLSAILRTVRTSDNLLRDLFDPLILAIVRVTLGQALLSTVLSLLLGIPLGLWLASPSLWPRLAFFQRLLILPFGVPTIVAVTSWIVIFGQSGLLARLGWRVDILYSWPMVVLAHVFFNIPFVALFVSEARSQIPVSHGENMRALGATRWQTFRFLTLPRIVPAALTAALQVFNLCTMSFAIVLILGGGPPVATMETAIYERLRFGVLDLTGASLCALWQLAINLIPTLILARSWQARRRLTQTASSLVRAPWTFRQMIALLLCLGFILPYASFLDGLSFSSPPDAALWQDLGVSLAASLRLAILTSILSLSFAILATINLYLFRECALIARGLYFLASLPTGISALVLGVGVWQAYGQWIDPFSGNLFLIAAIQATLFFPLVFRIFLANLDGFQERKIHLVQCLGASPMKAFYYAEWPRWQRPLVSAWSICLGASLAEISAVALFAGTGVQPLPVVIQQLLGQYRFAEAQLASAVLFVAAVGVMLASSRLKHGGIFRG